jgi:hypothetical protein
MNLDSTWQPPAGERPLEYLRAVSTGPATPLVLSVTTVGGGVSLGLSYRTACFSAAEVEQVYRRALELCELQGAATAGDTSRGY